MLITDKNPLPPSTVPFFGNGRLTPFSGNARHQLDRTIEPKDAYFMDQVARHLGRLGERERLMGLAYRGVAFGDLAAGLANEATAPIAPDASGAVPLAKPPVSGRTASTARIEPELANEAPSTVPALVKAADVGALRVEAAPLSQGEDDPERLEAEATEAVRRADDAYAGLSGQGRGSASAWRRMAARLEEAHAKVEASIAGIVARRSALDALQAGAGDWGESEARPIALGEAREALATLEMQQRSVLDRLEARMREAAAKAGSPEGHSMEVN